MESVARVVPRRREPLREILIEAAARLTSEIGWSGVTMGRLADEVGVSRQTVYNEVGGREALAEAMVLHELALFLDRVRAEFAGQTDLVAAIENASRSVLELATTDPLLRAVLSSTHGKSTDLLPLLTTESGLLLETATGVIAELVEEYDVPLPAERLDALIDMVVRLVLSHVMQPGEVPPEETARQIGWIAARVLGRR